MLVFLAVVGACALQRSVLQQTARMLGVGARVYTPTRKRDTHRDPIRKLGRAAMASAVIIVMGFGALVPFLSGIYQAPMLGVLAANLVVMIMGVADDL